MRQVVELLGNPPPPLAKAGIAPHRTAPHRTSPRRCYRGARRTALHCGRRGAARARPSICVRVSVCCTSRAGIRAIPWRAVQFNARRSDAMRCDAMRAAAAEIAASIRAATASFEASLARAATLLRPETIARRCRVMRWRAGRASEHCGAEGLGLWSGAWPLQGAAKAAPSKPQPKPTSKHTRWTLGEHDIDPGCAVLDGASVAARGRLRARLRGCNCVCPFARCICISTRGINGLQRRTARSASASDSCWSACSCMRYRAPLCVQTRVRAVARGSPRGRRMDHVGEGRRIRRRDSLCRREAEALDRQRRRAREGAARTGRHWAAGRIDHREADGRVERMRESHGRPRPAKL